jgi:ribosomal protein S6|tara:strand:- start:295 stop:660 length:366 start_codon:yes stop_codon:yes gene_type:complete
MPRYRTLLMASSAASRAQMKKVLMQTSESIVDAGGVMMRYEHYGEKLLAYKLSLKGGRDTRPQYARFMSLEYVCPPSMLSELVRKLYLNESIYGATTFNVEEDLTGIFAKGKRLPSGEWTG